MSRRDLLSYLFIGCLSPGLLSAAESREEEMLSALKDPVSYETALRLAVEADPLLDRNRALAEAADGRIEQAGLRRNPTVEVKAENFLGSGDASGVDGAEITVGISQVLETAGKREKRVAVARRDRELLAWERETRLALLAGTVREAFVGILLAEEKRALRRETMELAVRVEEAVAARVEAARAAQVDLSQARLEVSRHRFELERAERVLETAKARLAATWGLVPAPEFTVTGEVVLEREPPELEKLLALLHEAVALARFAAEAERREAMLELERAKAKPNVEVFAGSRYFNEAGGDVGFLVGVEIPWPLFDRNQGNIRAARAELHAVDHARDAELLDVSRQLTLAHRALVAASAEAETVESDLLPAAEQALADALAGYERGQFDLLTVLESREALFEVRQVRLDALARYVKASTRIERLTFNTFN